MAATMKDAAKIAGVPYRTVARWVEQGIIKVDGYVGRHWVPVPWTEKHTRELCTIARLRAAGLSLQRLREAAEYLHKLGHNPFSSGQFLVVGGSHSDRRLLKVCDGGEIMELTRKYKGQLLLFVPVGGELYETSDQG